MRQFPDLVLFQLIFKGRHVAAAVGNLPGEITIHVVAGAFSQIGRLGFQRRCQRPITLARFAMAVCAELFK